MHSSPVRTVAPVLVTVTQEMQIPIQLLLPTQSLKAVDTRALINSRANISCINWGFATKNKLPMTKLSTSIPINNVNQSPNKTGVIQATCNLFLRIKGIIMEETLHVMHCENVDGLG